MPSHATAVAYIALFVALGGSAYAITRIDSGDIVNDSLKSKDLRDGKAVAGRDVRQDTLTGEQIRENRLDPSQFSAFASGGGGCEPNQASTPCGEAIVSLPTDSAILAIAGAGFSGTSSAGVVCVLAFDGNPVASASVGQDEGAHQNSVTAESFGVSGISPKLPPGEHRVEMACRETDGDTQISDVRISAIALGTD